MVENAKVGDNTCVTHFPAHINQSEGGNANAHTTRVTCWFDRVLRTGWRKFLTDPMICGLLDPWWEWSAARRKDTTKDTVKNGGRSVCSTRTTITSMSSTNPVVFLDITIGGSPKGTTAGNYAWTVAFFGDPLCRRSYQVSRKCKCKQLCEFWNARAI